MLPLCILANLVRGSRSQLGETLKSVRARIRWHANDISSQWLEVLE